MVKQYVYVDSAATLQDLVVVNGNKIRLDINGLLMGLSRYALISLIQLKYISQVDLDYGGMTLKISTDTTNQISLNKMDSTLAICQFEPTAGDTFNYKAPSNVFQLMIAGNVQQLELYFADNMGNVISLDDASFACVLELETPDVGLPVREYIKSIVA